MDTWRRVEVAACEELPALLGDGGPGAAELDGDPCGDLHRGGGRRARAGDRPRHGRLRRRARRLGRPGRPLDPLRPDLLRRARHGARAAAREPGRARPAGRRRAGRGARRARARARAARSASGAPTACTPSRRPSGSSSPASPSRPTATRGVCERRSSRSPWARCREPSARTPPPPGLRGPRARPARPRARGRLDAGRRSRPPRRAAERDRARRGRGSSASRWRSATSSAPRSARSRSPSARARRAPRRCRTSATRSRPSRSRGSRAYCGATPRRRLEDVALWHERDISHSSVERVVLPDSHDPDRLPPAPRDRARRGHDRRPRADAAPTSS